MHYSQTHESQTSMNMQSDTSAHCTNTVCALYTMHAYANTNKSHPYALISALTQMHYTNMLHALFRMHIISNKSHTCMYMRSQIQVHIYVHYSHICTQITPVRISSFVLFKEFLDILARKQDYFKTVFEKTFCNHQGKVSYM